MKLLPKINPQMIELLSYTPLQYMLHAVEQTPEMGMIYADDEATPSVCIVRIGSLLFVGGRVTPACLAYIKGKILTFEIYEKYGVFYFFYPNEAWRDMLMTLYPEQSKIYERTLYAADPMAAIQVDLPSVIVPITAQLMESDTQRREMITDEVTTYKSFECFLKDGIGYAVLSDGEIQGFCTSEYQSKNELAIGIEVAQAYQKKGFAKAMTKAFLRDANHKGYKVYWESWKDNIASVNTALSCGFHHVADYPMIYLDLRDLNRDKRVPSESDVLHAVKSLITDVESIGRVPKGLSTYVYRIQASTGNFYARFLPEDSSFAAEVTAHKKLASVGVRVPNVVAFQHREEKIGLSMMVTEEIPGTSMEDIWPEDGAAAILREAGRQLASIHSIAVDGFGWIDRDNHETLKGEKRSFCEYFDDYLDDDLNTLCYYDLTFAERERIYTYMKQARSLLDVQNAVLVHGDFDVSHIFHFSGRYSGLIDFGEIRGNNRLFDLATFSYNDSSPDRTAYYCLIDGYREIAQLTDDDLYAIELMALFIVLRFAGKKVETISRMHWRRTVKKQLERLNQYPNPSC